MPRSYPPETRLQVIELARSGTRVAQLASTFGISEATIYNWLKQEQVSTGPIGLGVRFRAEVESMGRTAEMTIENTGYERPRRLASTTRMSTMDIEGVLLFEPVDGKTRMRWRWQLKPRGALRLISPMIARMGRRQEQTIWASLKRYLEHQELRGASPASR